MKAMLSQPMAGKTDEEIIATREKAIKALKEKGYEIINTLFTDEWGTAKRVWKSVALSRFHYVSLQSHLKICPYVIWHIFVRDGKMPEVAALNMKRQRHMDWTLFMKSKKGE